MTVALSHELHPVNLEVGDRVHYDGEWREVLHKQRVPKGWQITIAPSWADRERVVLYGMFALIRTNRVVR